MPIVIDDNNVCRLKRREISLVSSSTGKTPPHLVSLSIPNVGSDRLVIGTKEGRLESSISSRLWSGLKAVSSRPTQSEGTHSDHYYKLQRERGQQVEDKVGY
ncbi:hypothetical protein Adt_47191 [Abeliophyllum distichum]|uniref:Uncharacterized protein n=1 Tax=Abeliophyllum distichum TaxID=126358 RepID=A0ABD1NVG8_9LAMI